MEIADSTNAKPELSERYYICSEGHIHNTNSQFRLFGIADCNPSNLKIAGIVSRNKCPAAARPPQIMINKNKGKK